jgi:hypothetical protein
VEPSTTRGAWQQLRWHKTGESKCQIFTSSGAAGQEFGHYPDIEYISVFENCGDDEDMLPNELVKKYESDLHDAIEAAIRESKAESKFLSSMINDYKMGRV